MNLFQRLGNIAERLLPSRGAIHYLMAKTYYQWAVHSAAWGSTHWVESAREGFYAHVGALKALEKTKTEHHGDSRRMSWIRHCRRLANGMQTTERLANEIRDIMTHKQENPAKSRERMDQIQGMLRQLHQRIRRPVGE